MRRGKVLARSLLATARSTSASNGANASNPKSRPTISMGTPQPARRQRHPPARVREAASAAACPARRRRTRPSRQALSTMCLLARGNAPPPSLRRRRAAGTMMRAGTRPAAGGRITAEQPGSRCSWRPTPPPRATAAGRSANQPVTRHAARVLLRAHQLFGGGGPAAEQPIDLGQALLALALPAPVCDPMDAPASAFQDGLASRGI